jgi:hypothetical protein
MKGFQRETLVVETSGGVSHWRLKGENDPICELHQSIIMLVRVGRDFEDALPTCFWCMTWKSRRRT